MKDISAKYLFFVLLSLSIPSLKTYPRNVIIYSKNDSWLAVLFAGIIIMLMLLFLVSLAKRLNTMDFIKICNASIGPIIGSLVIALLGVFLVITLIECCSVVTNVFHSVSLQETPQWFFSLFLIIPVVYILNLNKTSFYTAIIVTVVLDIISGINLAILTHKYKHIKYLFPILSGGLSQDFLTGVVKAVGLLSVAFLLLFFLDEVKNKEGITKTVILSMAFLIQMQVFCMAGTLMTFYYSRATRITYTKIIQSELVNYFGFLESGEFFVMFQTYTGYFIKYLTVFYVLLKIMAYFKIPRKYSILSVSTIVFVITTMILQRQSVFLILLNYYTFLCIAIFIFIPIILYLVIWFKKSGNNFN